MIIAVLRAPRNHSRLTRSASALKINTRWAVKNFEEWAACHNKCHPENLCPPGVLLSDDADEVSTWLQKYVLGTRKTSGEKYPPRTLHMLLSGLQRYMHEQKEHSFHIFSQDLPPFQKLANTCDSYYRELREQGVGADTKETEVFTVEDIDKLWSSSVLNTHSPQGLLNAVDDDSKLYIVIVSAKYTIM